MFNYSFLTVKYTVESSLLCITLAMLLMRDTKEVLKRVCGAWWLLLLSGVTQGVLHYAFTIWFGNVIQSDTFTMRYIIMNLLTMLLFWILRIKEKRELSIFYSSYLLISMQFCQILATYVIFTMRSGFEIVTDFGPKEQLISQAIILLLFLLSYIIAKGLSRKIENMSVWEAALCALFDWCLFVIGRLMRRFFLKEQLYPYITAVLYLLFLVELALFFAIAIQMVYLRKTSVEEARLAQQYALQMRHADEISVLYRDFRRLRHEEKNQEIYVLHLLRTKNYDELQKYFEGLTEITDEYAMKIDSGNHLVNAILWAKVQTAEHEHIPMLVEAAVPVELSIEGAHLCSVLVNLIDNAIEASRHSERPKIQVTICMKQDYLFICVANAVDTNTMAVNPELRSTKKDKKIHGFGIRSVKLIAEQYNGICDFTVENHTFTATVMLASGSARPVQPDFLDKKK